MTIEVNEKTENFTPGRSSIQSVKTTVFYIKMHFTECSYPLLNQRYRVSILRWTYMDSD